MNLFTFLKKESIPYETRGKNTSRGFVNICCPDCLDEGFHGGIHIQKLYYNCWRCGWLPLYRVLGDITGLGERAVKDMLNYSSEDLKEVKERKEKQAIKEIQLPIGHRRLTKRHRDYLSSRNFDFRDIQQKWNIEGAGPLGKYKFRLLIPIYYGGTLVSYLGRDVTGKSNLRYKACEVENESIHHKHILYGLDHITERRCILVEGVTDVWRIGYGAVSSFGISWTKQQALLLAEKCDQIFIVFDAEKEAQKQAEKLGVMLSGFGVEIEIINIGSGDPGEMAQKDADSLKKSLLG